MGASLSLHLSRSFTVKFTEERLEREGDGLLEMMYRDVQSFPAAATLDYEGRFRSAGFDGTSGALRFGATWSSGRAEEDALRLLDAPASNAGDTGRYRNDSNTTTESAVGRAGWKIAKGLVDLSVAAGWHDAETDSSVRGNEAVTGIFAPGTGFFDLKATTEANARGWFGRGEVLVLPHRDWELLGRYESRSDAVIGTADAWVRNVPPPLPQSGPYFPVPETTRSDADLNRVGLEVRWRADRAWRFRVGAEQVRERIVSIERETAALRSREWTPTTVAATGGFDWVPNRRFDASVLARRAVARDAATALSLDEGNSLSVRLRAKRPDGWHATAFARLKRRSQEEADAFSTYDNAGFSMGNQGFDHSLEFTVSRERISTAADTMFVVDASMNPARTPHRVSYEETVTAFTMDVSQDLWGPWRAFGNVRWVDGNGDAPYVQSDASLGIGWRFTKQAELKIEGRRVAYVETDRATDDYAAKILTVSVAYEF
jgi:hypothetical protein